MIQCRCPTFSHIFHRKIQRNNKKKNLKPQININSGLLDAITFINNHTFSEHESLSLKLCRRCRWNFVECVINWFVLCSTTTTTQKNIVKQVQSNSKLVFTKTSIKIYDYTPALRHSLLRKQKKALLFHCNLWWLMSKLGLQ